MMGHMWIYLWKTSYICGPIKILFTISEVMSFSGTFFPFLFGTYGRNWSYMASQKN
jgi:hypothetical protein